MSQPLHEKMSTVSPSCLIFPATEKSDAYQKHNVHIQEHKHMHNTLAYTAQTCGFINICMRKKYIDKCTFAECECEWGGYLKATITFSSTVSNWCSGLPFYKGFTLDETHYPSVSWNNSIKTALVQNHILEYFEVLKHKAYGKTASYCSNTMN